MDMPTLPQPSKAELEQHDKLREALFATLNEAEGMPVALMIDALLIVAASVCLNAGLSIRVTVNALAIGMSRMREVVPVQIHDEPTPTGWEPVVRPEG